MTFSALARDRQDEVRLMSRTLPELAPRQARIAVEACGICGSDQALLRGRLRLLEAVPLPLWLGHEYAGTVVEVGADVDASWLDARVTAEPSAGCGRCDQCSHGAPNLCLHRRYEGGGFAPVLDVDASRLHRLPEPLPLELGTFFEPLACAVHALTERVRVPEGARCAVIGPGPLGLLSALALTALGAHTAVVGRRSSEARLTVASSLGLATQMLDDEPVSQRVVGDATNCRTIANGLGVADLNFTVGCTGDADSLDVATTWLAPGATHVELGLPRAPGTLDVESLVRREIAVVGSLGHTPRAWQRTETLLADQAIPAATLNRMVTARYPLSRWRDAFEAAADSAHVKVLVYPRNPA